MSLSILLCAGFSASVYISQDRNKLLKPFELDHPSKIIFVDTYGLRFLRGASLHLQSIGIWYQVCSARMRSMSTSFLVQWGSHFLRNHLQNGVDPDCLGPRRGQPTFTLQVNHHVHWERGMMHIKLYLDISFFERPGQSVPYVHQVNQVNPWIMVGFSWPPAHPQMKVLSSLQQFLCTPWTPFLLLLSICKRAM